MDITWKGATASSYGIVVTELPPVETAGRRDTPYNVPRKSGSIHVQDGSVDEIVKRVAMYLPYEQGVTVSELRTVMAWLSGSGQLRLSDEDDRYYNARIIRAVDYTPWVTGYNDRIVEVYFDCEPFAYHRNASAIDCRTSGSSYTNPGLSEARPLIQCTGRGNVTFTIGGTEFTLQNISGSASSDGTLYVDCRDMECYSQTGQGVRTARNYKMIGEFPVIAPGAFTIAWTPQEDSQGRTGSVVRVLLSPVRWCD